MSQEKTAVNAQTLTPEELIQIVRDLETRTPVVDVAALASKTHQAKLEQLPEALVDASLAAISGTPELQSALGRTDADVRAEDAEARNWAVAIEVARKFVDSLGVSNQHRRQRVGLTAMQSYQMCKMLSREPRFAKTLKPHVETMKRIIAKHSAKRQKTPETPAPQQIAA